jgi:hypothetical protein
MRRIALVLASLMVLMMSAAPAIADDWDDWNGDDGWGHDGWNTEDSGWHDGWDGWDGQDDWGGWNSWVDIDDVTDFDCDGGTCEFEGEGEFLDQPAEFEWECSDWWSCEVTDVDSV